jgi:hypothetical protein
MKILNKTTLRLILTSSLIVAASGWGCLSMQSQTSIDNVAATTAASNQPYVEGYVEYAGPQSKWAGPASFILHVSAKEAGDAQITTTPALLTSGSNSNPGAEPTLTQRVPAASSLSQAGGVPVFKKLTSTEAREQLARLATALQGGTQAPFRGCMSPVRVRLVRADGGIFERQGCRSELGWSRAVSESVSQFIDAAWNGVRVTAPGVPPQNAPKPATQTRATPAGAKRPARSVATSGGAVISPSDHQ